MDKQLLTALNSVSDSISLLAKAMEQKGADSDVGKTLQNSSITNQVKTIEKVITDIKKDTTEILSKQKEILAIQRSNNQSRGIGGFDFSNSDEIKRGASTIVLLAGSILAIGAAFKLVGEVDFSSVMALSLSLPLIAHSMGEIAQIKEIDNKNMFRLSSALFLISGSMALSSHILSKVSNVSAAQFLTILGISSAFGIIALGIGDLMSKKIKLTNMIKVPALMVLLSGAISASSYLLSSIVPLSIPQALTAIGIGGVFAVLSLSLSSITKNIGKITPDEIITLPAIMLTLSTAIMLSSNILNQTQPLTSVSQFLTIAGIATSFVIMSYALKPISNNIKDIDWSSVIKLPILFTAMSTAVMASSFILAQTQTIQASTLLNIILQSATLSATALMLYPAFKVFGKGNMLKELAISVVALPLVATAIMASSHLLALGNYTNFPDATWSAGVGLSLLTFGTGAIALGTIIAATGGIGAVAILACLLAVTGVATAIAGSSVILSKGTYNNSPSIGWAVSTSLLLTTFGAGAIALGSLVMATFGLGNKLLDYGNQAVLNIASTIVSASNILSKGTYKNTINSDWANGVALSLGAFAPIYGMMVANNILKIFGMSGVGVDDFNNAIKTISMGIVESARLFSSVSTYWGNAPTKAWAEGVGTAIGAFAPVFKILYEQDIFDLLFGSSVSPEDMRNTIDIITMGIVQSAQSFNNAQVDWTNVNGSAPTKAWAEGVSEAITSFSKIYELGKGFFSVNANDIRKYNMIIAGQGSSYNDSDVSIIGTLIRMNRKLSNENFIQYNPVNGLISTLRDYVKFITDIDESDVSISSISKNTQKLGSSLITSATGAEKFAVAVGKLAENVNRLDISKLNAFKEFTGIGIELSNVNKEQFISLMDSFNERTRVMAEAFDTSTFKNFVDKVGNFTSSINRPASERNNDRNIDDLYSMLYDMKNLMAQMVRYNKTMADAANEERLGKNNSNTRRNSNSS